MPHLSNEDFLTQLQSLFDKTKQQGKGTVFLTQKRYTFTPAETQGDVEMTEPVASSSSTTYPVILRATDGNSDKKLKIKLSTLVQSDDTERFYSLYGTLLRTSMVTCMKPKRRRPKTNAFSEKLPVVLGSKRGKGHSKRQRLIKARLRLLKRWRGEKIKAKV